MWPQPSLPPHPAMAEETRQSKLAIAKKKLKEYWQRNSLGVPAGVKRNRKTSGSSPETATSGGCHSPEDVSLGRPGSWGQGAQGAVEDCGWTVGYWLRILGSARHGGSCL
uniref:Uncharacterized protein n=1 Tax=Gorilla gorilla gorilla TaxID=9595 RepID=A0A2I2YNQ4_GORGO